MPRTKSCRFLSNIRSMLPLTIFRAMSACDLCRCCPAGPSAFQRSSGCWPTLRAVSHPPRSVYAGSAAVYEARADEAKAKRSVLCCAETLAMDQWRKWLTKWRLKSADLCIMRDSHMGVSEIKGSVPPFRDVDRLMTLLVSNYFERQKVCAVTPCKRTVRCKL